MGVSIELAEAFGHLHRGYRAAYGSGAGGWIKKPLTVGQFRHHLEGKGPGIGVGPLMDDGTCCFAAIDLDRPDFELAQELMKLLPGATWLERSRSGNAHVLAYFRDPIEAWVPRGIMREALAALGERGVEVFPKNDRLVGNYGNYLNLSYHGDARPMVAWHSGGTIYAGWAGNVHPGVEFELEKFVGLATEQLNLPDDWRKRAKWLGVPSPQEREASQAREFGTSPYLHKCAAYIIEHRDSNPVTVGHRAAVYFSLAKMLSHWSEIDSDEALDMMALVNDASPDPISAAELRRILSNAERGQYTSTSCDDALVLPFRDPTCKIGA